MNAPLREIRQGSRRGPVRDKGGRDADPLLEGKPRKVRRPRHGIRIQLAGFGGGQLNQLAE
jgi:hypothetical protein